MKHKLSQQQKMLQKMALTPQMRQSIQLLGMSTKDLSEYIDEVVEKNPCLQKVLELKRPGIGMRPSGQASIDDYTAILTQDENPRLSLLSQIRMLGLVDKQIEIAEYLLYELDENGYIQIDPQEAAEDLGVDSEEVNSVLEVIQTMDPPGIGARDVRECLQLQLKRMNKEDSLEYTIVTDFIKELAADDVKTIAKDLKIDEHEVLSAIKAIKKLNPRPASTILGKKAPPIIPDVIANIRNKKVTLGLNRDWLPRLKLYNPYEDKLDIIKDPEVREFLKENMAAARHLIDNLKRREDTMCKVASYILTFQVDSLAKGVKDANEIKPLNIKSVAEALNMHPSTISRTVSNKYIQIGSEVIPLNKFLSGGMQKTDGKIIFKTAIKKKIETIIKNEDKTKPLGDEDIMVLLERDNIKLKRRTVAKYRASLQILPAHLRKKST